MGIHQPSSRHQPQQRRRRITPKTLSYTGTLTITRCGVCEIPHAVPTEMYDDRLDNGGNWYCPSGHRLHFVETKSQKLEREASAAKRQAEFARSAARAARDQANAAERSARAYKGHATRLRNRIANGVCPVTGCRRHFDNVQAHIQGQHPEWVAAHPDVLGG